MKANKKLQKFICICCKGLATVGDDGFKSYSNLYWSHLHKVFSKVFSGPIYDSDWIVR